MAAKSDRLEALVAEHSSTVVPAAYFDRLVASLDEPDEAPGLARALSERTYVRRSWPLISALRAALRGSRQEAQRLHTALAGIDRLLAS